MFPLFFYKKVNPELLKWVYLLSNIANLKFTW